MRFLLFFIMLILFACSGDDTNPTYPFERSVLDISIAQTCENCYILRWSVPIETKDLQSFYVWLDTTVVKDSAQKISSSQINAADASKEYNANSSVDSLDITELLAPYLERDSVHLAIWAKYSGDKQGAVQHTSVHFGDNMEPAIVYFTSRTGPNTIFINWTRPTDQKDFYHPEVNNAPIAYYKITIEADKNEDIRNASRKVSVAGSPLDSAKIERDTNAKIPHILNFKIMDSKGVDLQNAQNNEWEMELSGLKTQSTYTVSITAYDSSITANDTIPNFSTTGRVSIKTTDEFPPDKIRQITVSDSLDSNRLVISWAPSFDYNEIKKYIVEKKKGEIWESIPRISTDTVYHDITASIITDTLRWLVPKEQITLRFIAVDNTNYYSEPLDTTITIPGENNCSEGFAQVQNGEATFCMEKYERNGNVLYNEAKTLCEADGYRLCTEIEWNAACTSRGIKYGFIEERDLIAESFLFKYCGVGTGVKDNRDDRCVSPDGVRDLPGQLQEWVVAQDGKPVLKGTSYKLYQGGSRAELAQCANRFIPKINNVPALYEFKNESVGFRCCY